MKFPVSVWSDYYSELTAEEMIEAFLQAGFSCTELSLIHTKKLLEREGSAEQVGSKLAEFAGSRNFTISQGHLSFKKGLCDPTAMDDLKRELDLFQAIGIQNAILHFNGGNDLPEQERFDRRLQSVQLLADYVNGTDITLCLENLPSVSQTYTVERIKEIIHAVNSDRLGICLDTGHLHLVNSRGHVEQSQSEFIHGAGKYLRALHITNNSGGGDDHLMPYSSRVGIDWKDVVKGLTDINYQGLFNLEILGENKAPMPIRRAKLDFIKAMTDYMLSPAFLAE